MERSSINIGTTYAQRYYDVITTYKLLGVIRWYEFHRFYANTIDISFDRKHELFDGFEKEIKLIELMEKI